MSAFPYQYQEDIVGSISFVKVVEQNPCIWNYTLKTYSRADITSAVWSKIAEQLKDTEQNCRDRWKNIRTAYGRTLKPPKPGTRWKARKPYYLAAHLDFLRPYMKASGNVPPEEETDNGSEGTSEQLSIGTTCSRFEACLPQDEDGRLPSEEHPVEDGLIDAELDVQQNTINRRKRKTNTQSSTDHTFSEWLHLNKKQQYNTSEHEEDGDWLFFRSMLVDFKKFDEARKRALKVKLLNLINGELEEAEAEAKSQFTWDSS